MTRVSALEDGTVTERNARYYERFVRGGFGLIITEGIYPDTAYSQGYLTSLASLPMSRLTRGEPS